jgi:hypothetical protein
MKKKNQKQRMTKTTGSSVMKKHPAPKKVHREGEKTYEAYADDYWDQAP